jgi:hypothetical protein
MPLPIIAVRKIRQDYDFDNVSKILNLPTPTTSGEPATKGYADSLLAGLKLKDSVRAATTTALPAVTYNNGTGGVGATLTANSNGALPAQDGVTLVVNDRLLVKNQTSTLQNGIYKVTQVGDTSNPFILTRTSDADDSPDGEVSAGMYTFVEEGITQAGTGFILTTPNPITIGTTGLTFTIFTKEGINAGNGLVKNGATLDIVSANSGILVNTDDIELRLATNSGLEISSGLKLASTVAGNGLTLTSGVLDVGAGTGITVNANDIAINTTVVGRKFIDSTTIIGDDSTTDFTITHNLNNQWVLVAVINTTTNRQEEIDVDRATANSCIVRFLQAPATGTNYVVTVIG